MYPENVAAISRAKSKKLELHSGFLFRFFSPSKSRRKCVLEGHLIPRRVCYEAAKGKESTGKKDRIELVKNDSIANELMAIEK